MFSYHPWWRTSFSPPATWLDLVRQDQARKSLIRSNLAHCSVSFAVASKMLTFHVRIKRSQTSISLGADVATEPRIPEPRNRSHRHAQLGLILGCWKNCTTSRDSGKICQVSRGRVPGLGFCHSRPGPWSLSSRTSMCYDPYRPRGVVPATGFL